VQMYMSQSGDPGVQGVLQQALERGNRHISALNGLMQEAGFTGASGH